LHIEETSTETSKPSQIPDMDQLTRAFNSLSLDNNNTSPLIPTIMSTGIRHAQHNVSHRYWDAWTRNMKIRVTSGSWDGPCASCSGNVKGHWKKISQVHLLCGQMISTVSF